ncbi:hypothetical protein AgCh_004760 [Apium graveolens]
MRRLIINMIDDGNGNQKRGWGLRGPQNNKTISNSNSNGGAPAERIARITSAPPTKRAAGAAGKCLVGQQPSEPGGALDEGGTLSKGKDRTVPYRDKLSTDPPRAGHTSFLFATAGKAVVEAKPIATPTIKYEIWPLLKDLMEWPSPPKSAYVIGAWLETGLMILISYPVGIIRMESPDPSFPKASQSFLRLPSSTHHFKEEFEIWNGSVMEWMEDGCMLDLRLIWVDCGWFKKLEIA